jgi:ribose transport system permease protein
MKINIKNNELFIAFIILLIFFGIGSERFFTQENIFNILRNSSITGVLVLGLVLVMINGDFDLSFASAVGLFNLLGLVFIDRGINMWIVFLFMIFGAIVWSLFNSFLIVKIGIHAFIATIATWNISKGFIYWINKGRTFCGYYPEELLIIGRRDLFGIPVTIILFILIATFIYMLANRTIVGRHLYAIGSNKIAAEYVGINSNRYRYLAYILHGFCIGSASIMLCSKLASGPASAGEGYLMTVIASVFLGATAFKVGSVNVAGAILGVLILTVIENGLVMLNVPFYFKYIVQAIIILLSVSFVFAKSKGGGPAIF